METIQQSNKQEILALILADMRNRKLIMGLEASGLHSEDFYTDLADIILSKTGFADASNEEVFAWYDTTLELLLETDLKYFRSHHRALAEKMYELLVEKLLVAGGSYLIIEKPPRS
jgi:hypothetical protein